MSNFKTTFLHYMTQRNQPYGSERRCCEQCGVMIWGASAPPYTDDYEVWKAAENNCWAAQQREASDADT